VNRTIGFRVLSCALVNLIAAALMASTAAAQTGASNQKWEVEVHGGGMFSSRSSDGTATLPAPGASFTTFTGFPSRQVSSWYFGDGAQLFNDLPATVRQNQSITSLNAPLGRGATSKSGGSIGGRVGYAITPRLTAEFSIDYGWSSIEIDSDALAEIETSRASFITAWNGALGIFGSPTVTSTISTDEGSSHQLTTSGVVLYKLTEEHRITPFVTGGIGVISNLGDPPSVSLSGSYSFRFVDIWPFTESDRVTVRYGVAGSDFVGVVGGGFTFALNAASGIRVDVRALLGRNSASTTLDATPFVQPLNPVQGLATLTTPSVQFVNNPALGAQSTLTGASLQDFETFEGSGSATVLSVTAGWYFRF
jgi:hypothetical protein